jgi:sulfofructose kinase
VKPIIVIGHAALDHVYRIEAFPREPVKVRALEHIEEGGGMAANAAATIARLGGPVELWSRVGGDEAGIKIKKLLERSGVGTRAVKICEGARSSTSAILVDRLGERLIVGERDHAMSMDASWLPLERIQHAAVVLSDLRWFEATRAAFERARALGVTTMIDGDLGGGEHLAEFVRLADYAIFSAPALEGLLPGLDDEARLERVIAMGVRHAGVTRGEQGYRWQNREGEAGHQPAFEVEVVDTTGAGDAFHGAFAWAVAMGLEDRACARIAAAVAALACRRLGARAGLPTEAEVMRFLASTGPTDEPEGRDGERG